MNFHRSKPPMYLASRMLPASLKPTLQFWSPTPRVTTTLTSKSTDYICLCSLHIKQECGMPGWLGYWNM